MDPLKALGTRWREEAEVVRRCGHDGTARLLERVADELEDAFRAWQNEELTVADAAAESGYTVDHMRRLLSEGTVPNAGAAYAPRILRRDLPRKPGSGIGTASCPSAVASKSQIVRSIVGSDSEDDDD